MNPYLYVVFPNDVAQPFDFDSQIANRDSNTVNQSRLDIGNRKLHWPAGPREGEKGIGLRRELIAASLG